VLVKYYPFKINATYQLVAMGKKVVFPLGVVNQPVPRVYEGLNGL